MDSLAIALEIYQIVEAPDNLMFSTADFLVERWILINNKLKRLSFRGKIVYVFGEFVS